MRSETVPIRFAVRGGGFAAPANGSSLKKLELDYLAPARSNKAAKLLGRKQRYTQATKLAWWRTLHAACRDSLR